MDWDSFESSHLPDDTFFRAAHAGCAHPDRPYAGSLVEVPAGTGGVRYWTLAAQFVETPSFAMAFVAEGCRKAARVEMRTARTVFMNDPVIGELGAAVFVQRGQL